MMSKAEAEALQSTAETVDTFMKTGFVVTFILNLALKGVMSQLWNIFNTLQIILALPLLTVVMPANVVMVQEVIDQIVNFSVLEESTVKEKVIEPVFGKVSDASQSLYEGEEIEEDNDDGQSAGVKREYEG